MSEPVRQVAFLDLETALSDRLNGSWERQYHSLGARIEKAVRRNEFAEAHDLVEQIDTSHVMGVANRKIAVTMGQTAVLLGAISVTRTARDTLAYQGPELQVLTKMVDQLTMFATKNASDQMKLVGHALVKKAELKEYDRVDTLMMKSEFPNFGNEVRMKISYTGQAMFSLGGSAYVSRMRSRGFLQEADRREITVYKIQAILDNRTTPICRHMDGRTFRVVDAKAQLDLAMNSEDPEVWRAITPWSRRTSGGTKGLADMTNEDLYGEGLYLPPYHPLCRTVAVTEQQYG